MEENNSKESLDQFFEALPVGGAHSLAKEVYHVFTPSVRNIVSVFGWKTFLQQMDTSRPLNSRKGFPVACVASVSVGFGSKELQRENGASKRRGRWRGRKEGNACRQTPGF